MCSPNDITHTMHRLTLHTFRKVRKRDEGKLKNGDLGRRMWANQAQQWQPPQRCEKQRTGAVPTASAVRAVVLCSHHNTLPNYSGLV